MGLGSFTYNDFYMSKCCEANVKVITIFGEKTIQQISCEKCKKYCELELRTKYV